MRFWTGLPRSWSTAPWTRRIQMWAQRGWKVSDGCYRVSKTPKGPSRGCVRVKMGAKKDCPWVVWRLKSSTCWVQVVFLAGGLIRPKLPKRLVAVEFLHFNRKFLVSWRLDTTTSPFCLTLGCLLNILLCRRTGNWTFYLLNIFWNIFLYFCLIAGEWAAEAECAVCQHECHQPGENSNWSSWSTGLRVNSLTSQLVNMSTH